MSEQTGISGELIYEYTPLFTQVVEYGISADAFRLPGGGGAQYRAGAYAQEILRTKNAPRVRRWA